VHVFGGYRVRFRGSDPLDHEANAWALLHVPFLGSAVRKRAYDYLFKGYWRPIHRLYTSFHGISGPQTRSLVHGVFQTIHDQGTPDDKVSFRDHLKTVSFEHIEAQDPSSLGLNTEVIETPRNEPTTQEAMLAFGPFPTLEFDADFAESLIDLAYADFNTDCTEAGRVDQARAIQLAYIRPPQGKRDEFLEAVGRPLRLRGEEVARLLYTARQAFRVYVVTEVRTTLPPSLLHSENALMTELGILGRALKIRATVGGESETRRLDEAEVAGFFSLSLE
jgi:hypothetical protein